MKVTNVKVSAGRTFNHPYESYSNFKHSVVLDAALEDGEDAPTAVKELQSKSRTPYGLAQSRTRTNHE